MRVHTSNMSHPLGSTFRGASTSDARLPSVVLTLPHAAARACCARAAADTAAPSPPRGVAAAAGPPAAPTALLEDATDAISPDVNDSSSAKVEVLGVM